MTKVRILQLGLLLAIVFGLFLFSLALGSVTIPVDQVIQILRGSTVQNPIWSDIVWQLRLPRALTAIVAGAALAVGGLQMQTLFRNPLADPSILGINAGASLGVAIVVLATNLEALKDLKGFENTSILMAASIGSALTLTLMLIVSQKASMGVGHSVRLLIFGLMFGYITSAMVTILLQLSSLTETQTYLNWTFGSFAAISLRDWPLFAISIGLGLTIAQGLAIQLNLLALGEETAQSLGAQIGAIRFGIILSTALLAGTVTAFCGPIAFLGVAVPHFCRQLFRSVDHRFLIPANALLGSALAIVADSIAQLPGQDAILPLNSVTILIGAPAVIWIVLKNAH